MFIVYLLSVSPNIPTRKDHARLQWPNWLKLVSATDQQYVYDEASHRPHILKQSKRSSAPGRNHLNKSFLSEEDLIKFLRRNASELLKKACLLQRDAEYALALCRAEGHEVVFTPVDAYRDEHRGAKEAHDRHWHEAEQRFRYLWPGDLREAARLWREEASGAFPPTALMSTAEFLARAREASLLKAIVESGGTIGPAVRNRL